MGEAHTKKHGEQYHEKKIEVIIYTLQYVEVKQNTENLADTVIKVNTRTVGDTLVQLQANALINRPGDTLE